MFGDSLGAIDGVKFTIHLLKLSKVAKDVRQKKEAAKNASTMKGARKFETNRAKTFLAAKVSRQKSKVKRQSFLPFLTSSHFLPPPFFLFRITTTTTTTTTKPAPVQFDFGPKEERAVSSKLAEWAFRYAVSGPRAVGPAGLKGFLANQRLSPTELRDQVRR